MRRKALRRLLIAAYAGSPVLLSVIPAHLPSGCRSPRHLYRPSPAQCCSESASRRLAYPNASCVHILQSRRKTTEQAVLKAFPHPLSIGHLRGTSKNLREWRKLLGKSLILSGFIPSNWDCSRPLGTSPPAGQWRGLIFCLGRAFNVEHLN